MIIKCTRPLGFNAKGPCTILNLPEIIKANYTPE